MLQAMDESTAASALVGRNLRAWRESVMCSQDSLARRMQAVGFPWRQPTVAQVENGRRAVSFEEFLGICIVTGQQVGLHMAHEDGERVRLGTRSYPASAVQGILNEGLYMVRDDPPEIQEWIDTDNVRFRAVRSAISESASMAAALWLPVELDTEERRRQITLDATGDAEVKMARSLAGDGACVIRLEGGAELPPGPDEVAAISHALWGHTLTVEREHRLIESGQDIGSPDALRARRGHITRELAAEITRYAEVHMPRPTEDEYRRIFLEGERDLAATLRRGKP